MASCPKCGKKISVFYLKPTCSKCGINLMYYNMETRLEEDAAKAEREVETMHRFSNKIKSFFRKNHV